MFDRVRAGEEQLQAIAEGCLSLLRELIRSSTAAATPSAAVATAAGRRSRKGGRGNGGASATAAPLDTSGRSSLLAGLKGAFALLMETESHSLVQVSERPSKCGKALFCGRDGSLVLACRRGFVESTLVRYTRSAAGKTNQIKAEPALASRWPRVTPFYCLPWFKGRPVYALQHHTHTHTHKDRARA